MPDPEKYYVITDSFDKPTKFAADNKRDGGQHWTAFLAEARRYGSMEEMREAPFAKIPGTFPMRINRIIVTMSKEKK